MIDGNGSENYNETEVGPILEQGHVADAVVAAIRELNPGVTVIDRGSYLRVFKGDRCTLSREAVERHLGRPFFLPGDLETVMPSFRGKFEVSDDNATWTFFGRAQ